MEPLHACYILVAVVVFYHIGLWLLDPHRIRSVPGPFLAHFSDLWLIGVSITGHRSERVHELHEQYGPVIRIAPNHVSIASTDALASVYAHGNGALKSNFYDAFVSIQRGLFNTRDRTDHARKRKLVSHIFSQKSVLEFEPHIRLYVGQLLDQWSRLFDLAVKGESGSEGEGGWVGKNGRLFLDVLPWCNYLAFDIIGDLAFGSPFEMLKACKDSAPIPVSQAEAMAQYEKETSSESKSSDIQVRYIPAVKILNGRGEYSMTMGVIPPFWRPFARHLPWFRSGVSDVKALAGIAIMAVRKRLHAQASGELAIRKTDLLQKLQNGKDDAGNPMGREELTAEALTLLIAGSDTTSNSTCAIIYHLARTPAAQRKLQEELDAAIPSESLPATVDDVKADRLPYLDACINEGLRIHSTSAIGLPRIVPPGGLTLHDKFFPEGTVLSVPSYSIHRDPEVWGTDVEDFRPERWLDADKEQKELMNKTFNPFSVGPRACVGRNLAFLELQIIVASLVRKYDFVLESKGQQLETSEGFLRKPLHCRVGIQRRD